MQEQKGVTRPSFPKDKRFERAVNAGWRYSTASWRFSFILWVGNECWNHWSSINLRSLKIDGWLLIGLYVSRLQWPQVIFPPYSNYCHHLRLTYQVATASPIYAHVSKCRCFTSSRSFLLDCFLLLLKHQPLEEIATELLTK